MSEKIGSEQYEVHGHITFAESGQPAPGLRVVAMDADRLCDDKLGEAVTDKSGGYRIAYDRSKFAAFYEAAPDVYLQIYGEGSTLLVSTRECMVAEAGRHLEINLQIPGSDDVPTTRSQFNKLILGNPNFFGTMPDFDLPPVAPMSGNTAFEALTCLGLQPDQDRLEAVVTIKRPYGYKTDPCGDGSTEYVRFFVERDGAWEDLGVETQRVYNMPDSDHPLCYAISIPFDEPEKYCKHENLLTVRAILSWELEPPPGNAAWPPIWGNVLDARVQIDAWKLDLVPVGNLVAEGIFQVDPSLLEQLDLTKPLPVKAQAPLPYAKLKEMYAGADVPAHRFGFTEVAKLAASPLPSKLFASPVPSLPGQSTLIPGPELAEIFDDLVATSGNTSYEELTCAGYNPQTHELGAVIGIKRSTGYSGGLCSSGSKEYVGFWVEYGAVWHPLGVAEVQVYDLSGAGGGNVIEYAVFRATNAVPEMPCEGLAGLRLRAILSWQTPPTGPDFSPTWGNAVETYIQPPIGEIPEDKLNRLRLMRFNRAPIDKISNVTGRATDPTPVAGDCGGIDRPFGNTLYIEGDFVFKPDFFDHLTGDVLAGQHPLRYQVFWRKDGLPATETQLTNSFTIKVFPQDATLPETKTQSVTPIGAEQYYTYMESATQAVNPRTLAVWQAGGLDDGLYVVKLKGFAWNGSSYVQTNEVEQKIYVYNGFPHIEAVSQPDGTVAMVQRQRPELTLTMEGGACRDLVMGATVSGTYTVRDDFFGVLGVRMVPITLGGTTYQNPVTITNPGAVVPHPGVNPSVQTVSGDWEMSTAGLPACGYTIELVAWDRALVSNSCSGHYNRIGVGFCLREPTES